MGYLKKEKSVFELIQSGGLLMIPILFCSVLAMGIIGERFVTLQKKKIVPPELVAETRPQKYESPYFYYQLS
jgi:biopolymer transport protein ExbB/TolQ